MGMRPRPTTSATRTPNGSVAACVRTARRRAKYSRPRSRAALLRAVPLCDRGAAIRPAAAARSSCRAPFGPQMAVTRPVRSGSRRPRRAAAAATDASGSNRHSFDAGCHHGRCPKDGVTDARERPSRWFRPLSDDLAWPVKASRRTSSAQSRSLSARRYTRRTAGSV